MRSLLVLGLLITTFNIHAQIKYETDIPASKFDPNLLEMVKKNAGTTNFQVDSEIETLNFDDKGSNFEGEVRVYVGVTVIQTFSGLSGVIEVKQENDSTSATHAYVIQRNESNLNFYGVRPAGAIDVATVPNADGLVDLFNSAASNFTLKDEDDQQIFETYYKAYVGLRRAAPRSSVKPHLEVTKNAAKLVGLEFGGDIDSSEPACRTFQSSYGCDLGNIFDDIGDFAGEKAFKLSIDGNVFLFSSAFGGPAASSAVSSLRGLGNSIVSTIPGATVYYSKKLDIGPNSYDLEDEMGLLNIDPAQLSAESTSFITLSFPKPFEFKLSTWSDGTGTPWNVVLSVKEVATGNTLTIVDVPVSDEAEAKEIAQSMFNSLALQFIRPNSKSTGVQKHNVTLPNQDLVKGCRDLNPGTFHLYGGGDDMNFIIINDETTCTTIGKSGRYAIIDNRSAVDANKAAQSFQMDLFMLQSAVNTQSQTNNMLKAYQEKGNSKLKTIGEYTVGKLIDAKFGGDWDKLVDSRFGNDYRELVNQKYGGDWTKLVDQKFGGDWDKFFVNFFNLPEVDDVLMVVGSTNRGIIFYNGHAGFTAFSVQ